MEKQHAYEKIILALELIGFGAVLAIIWLDDYADVPFRFFSAFKAPRSPQYWFETVTILLLATAIVSATLWVFRRLRLLEDFIRVCAWCRKVEVENEWVSFEQYMKRQHDVPSTHGICPECRANASKNHSLGETATLPLTSAAR